MRLQGLPQRQGMESSARHPVRAGTLPGPTQHLPTGRTHQLLAQGQQHPHLPANVLHCEAHGSLQHDVPALARGGQQTGHAHPHGRRAVAANANMDTTVSS
eukprot:6427537-Alexandrium_andersonii.AAC.1